MTLNRLGRHLAALLVVAAVAVPAASLAASDPYRSQQYGLDRIKASDAWPVSRAQGMVIAIVDSGVDLTHPDLVDRFLRDGNGKIVGRDYVDGDTVPQDRNGHGTMVAGVAAAATANGVGIAGVAPGALIMPIRVLDEEGSGRASDVDAAIRWAVDNGAHVVNLSLESVAPLPGDTISQAPHRAVQYAWDRGVVVVAAAGNSGSPFTDYPSSSPIVLVGATDRNDQRALFSDSGRRDALMAPGVSIISTWCKPVAQGCDQEPRNRYGQADGTSFSAPHVAGAAAVVLATGRDAEATVARLRNTAEDLGAAGPDATYGFGRIDLARAVAPRSPEPEPTTAAGQDPSAAPRPSASPSPSPSSSPSTSARPTSTPSPTPGSSTTPGSSPAPDPAAPTTSPSSAAPSARSSTQAPSSEPGTVEPDPTGSDPTAPGTLAPEPSTPATDPTVPVAAPSPADDPDESVRVLAVLAVLASATAWVTVWRRGSHAR